MRELARISDGPDKSSIVKVSYTCRKRMASIEGV